MPILHQIIAIERGVKQRTYGAVSELHKENQKPQLFEGFTKQYQPKEEGGEAFPPENAIAQRSADEQLKQACALMTELLDVTATRDYGNASSAATADVVVNGHAILRAAPVSYLLFLEKQLTDLRAFIATLPVLDPGVKWTADTNAPVHYSPEVKTHRTKKVQKALTLAASTDKHPAQAVQVTEDEVVGYWTTTRQSGAMPANRRITLLARVDELAKAVKFAREQANGATVQAIDAGTAIFKYLLA